MLVVTINLTIMKTKIQQKPWFKQKVTLFVAAVLVTLSALITVFIYLNQERSQNLVLAPSAPNQPKRYVQAEGKDADQDEQSSSSAPENSEPNTAEPIPEKTFNFLDTTGWRAESSPSGAISVKVNGWATGACKDNDDVLLTGIVVMNGGNKYNCKDGDSALALRVEPLVALRVIFEAALDTYPVPSDAVSQDVTLLDGGTARRYVYTNETIQHILYIYKKNNKEYRAHFRIEPGFSPFQGSISLIDDFDTTVQKTMTVK